MYINDIIPFKKKWKRTVDRDTNTKVAYKTARQSQILSLRSYLNNQMHARVCAFPWQSGVGAVLSLKDIV